MTNRQGFTLVEVLVAMMVLTIGVMALVGASATVTKMIGGGRHDTRAVLVAEQRLEVLRQQAYRQTPFCTHGSFAGGNATTLGMTERWGITGAGSSRTIVDTVIYRVHRNRGRATDTLRLQTVISCL